MCEHAGMLNHLYAKIEDLGIGEGDVVAQTAPQCFDISLWQLVVRARWSAAARCSSSRRRSSTSQRFVDTIAAGRVGVLQVVPSYLEVVALLPGAAPARLPDLRCVSATGEALKRELVAALVRRRARRSAGQRLRADRDLRRHQPRGDATGCPRGTGCRSGRAVRNVRVYVVDEKLRPVPLGAPGAIVFSGVCVGRGYINDPERTRRLPGRSAPAGRAAVPRRRLRPLAARRQAGVPRPPRQPGQDPRLPDRDRRDRERAAARARRARRRGGRRRAAGPRAGTWWRSTPAPRRSRPRCCGDAAGRVAARVHGAGGVPPADEPAAHRERQDRQEGAARARRRAGGRRPDGTTAPPSTPTERRLAAAWAHVLGVAASDRIGRHDNFFDRGGTSLSAVKLAIAWTGRCRSRTSPGTRCWPNWPRWSTTARPNGWSFLLPVRGDGALAR